MIKKLLSEDFMLSAPAHILVVDDELFFRKLYRDILVDEGYQVDVCDSGEEAIALLQRQSVDLILTDMVMVGCSGLDVLQKARSLPHPPDVILVTAHASLESAINALKNGARDYLVKPFDPSALKHVVQGCLDQRRLLAENDHLRKQIELFETGQSLSSLIDLDRLVTRAVEALMREMGASSGCAFTLRGEETTTFLVDHSSMSHDSAEQLIELLLPEFVHTRGLHQLGEDWARKVSAVLQYEQVWILSLCDDDALKGGVVVCGAGSAAASSETKTGLRYLCDQVMLGFENACRYQDAQQLMYTDDLTGLYNHRYMQVALGQEINRSLRYGLRFSLLFLDLDRFKEINDKYGHLAGSSALQEVGQLLRESVRDVDTLFRFGGDEFAVILVEADDRTARCIAERIRKEIEDHAFLEAQGTPSFVTVTAGFATFPTDATEQKQLLELADQAMYAGKVTRNVICSVRDIVDRI